jgi:hypothetical protein
MAHRWPPVADEDASVVDLRAFMGDESRRVALERIFIADQRVRVADEHASIAHEGPSIARGTPYIAISARFAARRQSTESHVDSM